jgi:hypothetical protein
MGNIKISSDGTVEITEAKFNPMNMDENMIELAIRVFGSFFERAVSLEKISFRIEEETEDIQSDAMSRAFRISKGWRLEILPWQDYHFRILTGKGEEITL